MAAAATGVQAAAPWCQPSQACWPNDEAWASFNATVGGRLLAVFPPLAGCFVNPPDPTCQADIANYTNPIWRASQPGAMQDPVWEEDAAGNACFNPNAPCLQGNVPPMAVAVAVPSDVAAAFAFAAQYNILVVVKSTGHEYNGRSTGPGALQIWMHTMQGIDIVPAFTSCPGDAPAPAVVVTGGTQWRDVYNAVSPAYEVVGGSCSTVGAAGGYVLGGGHSFSSPAYGLAVDNVLAFTAVLVNGTMVNVSSCSHPQLFWALRGGGGGTFAVITSVTYRLHPTPSDGVTGASVTIQFLRGQLSLAVFLDVLMASLPSMATAPTPGAVVAGGSMMIFSTSGAAFNWVFNGSQNATFTAVMPMINAFTAQAQDLLVLDPQLTPFSSMIEWHDSNDDGATTGGLSALGSWTVPLQVCSDPVQRPIAASALAAVLGSTSPVTVRVLGGAVAAMDPNSSATSISSAFRQAAMHMILGLPWNNTDPVGVRDAVFAVVSNWTAQLRNVFPYSGAYFSESDYLLPQWQEAFWGAANYNRLQAIKAAYDPNGALTCWHCVELPSSSTMEAGGGMGM